MPFGSMMGAAGKGAMGMGMQSAQRNNMMQQKQGMPKMQMASSLGMKPMREPSRTGGMGQGLAPSKGMMGSMMGNRMGQMGSALGGAMGLGGFQQQRQIGRNRQMPMQPRQDMYEPPQIGMSNTQLPQQPSSMEQPPMMQQLPAPPMQQEQDPMQQALAAYGPKSSLRRQPGIGPSY